MKATLQSFNIQLALLIVSSIMVPELKSNAQSSSQGNNNGSTFSVTAISGSTATWNNPINAKIVDGAFATNSANLPAAGNYTDYLVATNFGFTIPGGNIIDGIKVSVSRLEDHSEVKDYKIRLVKANVIGTTDRLSGVAWPSTNTTRAYGSSSDLWGDAWNISDINSSGFGFAIAVQRLSGGAFPVAAKIDNVRITVYYSADPSPLPVELVSFAASATETNISLNWQTASEINNDFFTLEKSQDGINYSPIRLMKGAGNSTTTQNYSYVDNITNTLPIFYYRLMQTDYDGTTTEIGMKAIKMKVTTDAISVYPNPFSESIHVCLDDISMPVTISLTNENGKVIQFEKLNSAHRETEYIFHEIGKMKSGIYYLSIDNGTEKSVKKIIKNDK